MATTPEGVALTRAHRVAQIRLGATAPAAVEETWGLLDLDALDASTPTWAAVTSDRMRTRYAASQRLAGVYLERFSTAEVGSLSGPVVAPSFDEAQALRSLLYAGPVTTKRLIGLGYDPALAFAAGKRAVTGRVQAWTLSGGRRSVIATGRSWRKNVRRVSDGNPCAFCAMLVARGAAYSQETAGFKAHPHCGCTAEIVFGPFEWNDDERAWRDAYDQAARAADRAGEPRTQANILPRMRAMDLFAH